MNVNCQYINYGYDRNGACQYMNYGYDNNGAFTTRKIPDVDGNKNNYKILNMHGESSHEFMKIEKSPEHNGQTVYKSMDARLYDAARNDRLGLDKPPPDGSIDMEKIHNNPTLVNYRCGSYKNYEDIKAGQIVYYTSDKNKNPFSRPVFMEKSTVYGIRYKDPMDTTSDIYIREPIEFNNPMNTLKKEYNGGLSWIQDSSSFREDLIARQKIKMNSRKWF